MIASIVLRGAQARWRVLVILSCLAGMASAAWASPTSWIVVPTPDTVQPGDLVVDFATQGRSLTGSDCDRWLETEFGVAPRVEAGVDTCLRGDAATLFNAKWQCVEQSGKVPAIAVGIESAGRHSVAQPYLVLGRGSSKGHWGVGLIGDGERLVEMLGGDYALTPTLSVLGDHVGGSAGTTSAGLSWQVSEQLNVTSAGIWERDPGQWAWFFYAGYTATLWR